MTQLHGIGALTAGKILGRVGTITRFRSAAAFASYTGTAPIDVSSGDVKRHRLSRAGDRQLNYCLHVMAITQIRQDTPGRTYYLRKRSEGKSHQEALRCLKRRLSDAVYHQLVNNATAPPQAAGHAGDGSDIQRGRLTPLYRHFGPVTHRASQPPRYNQRPQRLTQRGTTNLTGQSEEFVIDAYHQLWRIEKAFRMSKHDLQARPIYHHTRESIEAHLSIVVAAMAVNHHIEHQTGRSIKKFVRTARRYRTVKIKAGTQILTAADPLPDDLRDALATIGRAGVH